MSLREVREEEGEGGGRGGLQYVYQVREEGGEHRTTIGWTSEGEGRRGEDYNMSGHLPFSR